MKSIFVFKTLCVSVLLSVCSIFMASTARYGVTENNFSNDNFTNDGFTAASFKKFVALFPAKELPYKIGADEMNSWITQRKNKANAPAAKPMQQARISDEFDDFIPEIHNAMFSRMGPDIFTPEAVLAKTDKHIILLYSRSRGYSERKGSQYLAVYSPKGKRLSEMLVAKSDGYEGFMGCKITKTQTGGVLVSTTSYVNQWKNDKARYDDDNFITAVTPKKTTSRILTAEGELEEVQMP